jgi:hypothetical protein
MAERSDWTSVFEGRGCPTIESFMPSKSWFATDGSSGSTCGFGEHALAQSLGFNCRRVLIASARRACRGRARPGHHVGRRPTDRAAAFVGMVSMLPHGCCTQARGTNDLRTPLMPLGETEASEPREKSPSTSTTSGTLLPPPPRSGCTKSAGREAALADGMRYRPHILSGISPVLALCLAA